MSKNVEKIIACEFKNVNILKEALTHKSFCIQKNKNNTHNERLEFLGDAILGLIIAENLMVQFPQDNEGMLSKKRASLINQDTLAKKALILKLDQHLIMGPGEKEQKSQLKPRILASVYEAIIGAIYLDSNFLSAQRWVGQQFEFDIRHMKPEQDFEKDYKTRLQELVYKLNLNQPSYELISTIGPSHDPQFLVALKIDEIEKSRASGRSKKIAEQNAAEIYMKELNNKKMKTNTPKVTER